MAYYLVWSVHLEHIYKKKIRYTWSRGTWHNARLLLNIETGYNLQYECSLLLSTNDYLKLLHSFWYDDLNTLNVRFVEHFTLYLYIRNLCKRILKIYVCANVYKIFFMLCPLADFDLVWIFRLQAKCTFVVMVICRIRVAYVLGVNLFKEVESFTLSQVSVCF